MILAAPIAGIRYRPDRIRDYVKTLKTGDPLRLVPETDNPHDKLALRVFSGDHMIGYVTANPSSVHNKDFHAKKHAWDSARFVRNVDTGEARVGIEVADER